MRKRSALTARERKDIGIFILAFLAFVAFGYTYAAGMGQVKPVTLPPVQEAPSTVSVPYLQIATGLHSGITQKVNYVITSQDELAKLWKMIGANGSAPQVDFGASSVLAVFAGHVPTTGYSIAVTKVEDANTRTVSITLTKPDASCIEGQVVMSPYQIIMVPATTLQLMHTDTIKGVSCKN